MKNEVNKLALTVRRIRTNVRAGIEETFTVTQSPPPPPPPKPKTKI